MIKEIDESASKFESTIPRERPERRSWQLELKYNEINGKEVIKLK